MYLLKNFSIYFGTEFINKLIPFLLLPLITTYLTPVEFGTYGIYQVFVSFLSPVISMSLQTNITRNFFKVSKEEMSRIISSLFLILTINIVIAMIIILIASFFLEDFFNIPKRIVYILPLLIYIQTINIFNLTILRNEEKALKYGIIQIMLTLINYVTLVFMLLSLHFGWLSFVYSAVIAHFIVAVYSLLAIKKEFFIGFDFFSLKNIYAVSIPLIFHSLGGGIIAISDRLFIEKMMGLKEVGIYTIASQFGMIVMIVTNIIMTTINPWLYKKLAQDDQLVVKKMYLLMLGFTFLGLAISCISIIVFPIIIDKQYHSATNIILALSIVYILRGFYQIFHTVIVHEGKTKFLMYITFGGAIINIFLNYFLIPLYGLMGAISATLTSYLFIVIFTIFFANKYSSLKWL